MFEWVVYFNIFERMWAGAPKRVSGLHKGLWIVPAEMHPVSKLASTGYWLAT